MMPTVDDVAALRLEVQGLVEYFDKLLIVISNKVNRKIITRCHSTLKKIIEYINDFYEQNFSFMEIFIKELKASRNIFANIKKKSKKFKKTSSIERVLIHISKLRSNLKTNVFLSKRSHIIDSGNTDSYTCLPKELSDYLKIGHELKDEDATIKLKEELALLKNSYNDCESSYYAAIIGPSFMGKTQTAFTLSHLMNVMYVNLLSTARSDSCGSQPIYDKLRKFSKLFSVTIEEDLKLSNIGSAGSIYGHSARFRTLGLLYCLILRKELNPNETPEQNFLAILNIKKALVPKMTPSQFRSKMEELGIRLDDHLVFIDEFPVNHENYAETIKSIKFLRNLCRGVFMPSILSGTDSSATNLIGQKDSLFSGEVAYSRKWVKVITKLVQPTIKSLCCTIEVKPGKYMSDFVNDDDTFDYSAFISNYNFKSELSESLDDALNILKYIFKYSKTGLPGFHFVAIVMFKQLLDQALIDQDSLPRVFDAFYKNLFNHLKIRKKTLNDPESALANVHILSFPCAEKLANEQGKIAACKVHRHFFYFGNHGDATFDLNLAPVESKNNQQANEESHGGINATLDADKLETAGEPDNEDDGSPKLFKNGKVFEQSCHFAYVYDDFLLCYCLWNSWYYRKLNQEYSLAKLYVDFLKNSRNFSVDSDQEFTDSFTLELLAFWSIAYASHYDCHGNASGIEVIDEFVKNLQAFDNNYKKKFETYDLPPILETFLKKVKVPYLICGTPLPVSKKIIQPNDSDFISPAEAKRAKKVINNIPDSPDDTAKIQELITDMEPLVKIGMCYRPKNKVGWDVLYDMEYLGHPVLGYIECKLWTSPVGLPLIFPYYMKACLNKYKLSILVCSKIQVSLSGDKAAKKFSIKPENPSINAADEKKAVNKPAKQTVEKSASKPDPKKVKLEKPQEAGTQSSKTKKTKQSCEDKLMAYWKGEEEKAAKNEENCRINIYTVTFNKTNPDEVTNNIQTGTFTFGTLKEFDDPTGVFLIVESSFNPESRSSHS